MRVLLIDNYDSYTFNLLGLMRHFSHQVYILRNDAPIATLDCFDCCIISPGPGHPKNLIVVTYSLINCRILEFATMLYWRLKSQYWEYVLGTKELHIASNHQYFPLLIQVCEADPVHGSTSDIIHDGQGVFKDIPIGFKAVRYHSLHVPEPCTSA